MCHQVRPGDSGPQGEIVGRIRMYETVSTIAFGGRRRRSAAIEAVFKATGEMVAVNQDTGQVEWDTRLPSSPYGAATVTSNVMFTTTFHGDLYARSTATDTIRRKIALSAGTNAPVAIDGDYVVDGTGVPLSKTQQPMIIACKLGATGKLPETVSP